MSVDRRYNWLKQDLARANDNRLAVPWIIVFGHRPMYCNVASVNVTTNSTGCDGEQEQSRNGAYGGPGMTSGGDVGSSDFAVEDLLYVLTFSMFSPCICLVFIYGGGGGGRVRVCWTYAYSE